MLLTEEQAAERWCPFARTHIGARMVGGLDGVPGTHTGSVPEGPAVNRWAVMEPEGEVRPFEIKLRRVEDYARCIGSRCMAWRLAPDSDDVRGYCGLAGFPRGAS